MLGFKSWLKALYKFTVTGILFFVAMNPVFSEEGSLAKGKKTENQADKSFKPGEFIFEHIGDSYGWHILTWNGQEISVPLPVILFSRTKGWVVFSSAKLDHGKAMYNDFKLELEGPNKGKVVEIKKDGSQIKPLDISITKNVCAVLFSILLLLTIFLSTAKKYKSIPGQAPSGLQNALEVFIVFIRDDIAKPSIGHKYEKFMPYLLTVFFFIWFNNMLGLIPIMPGGANVTGNIAVTLVLAVFTFVITSINGNLHYWREFVDAPGVPWWLKLPIPLMPIVEISGLFIKPFVLMVRLFANMTAGHIVALGFFCLIFFFGNMNPAIGYGVSVLSVSFVIFMSLLELLVALIQAYVFTLLSALYFGMATTEHHTAEEHH